MEERDDIHFLRTDPKRWEGEVWDKLWATATSVARHKLLRVSPSDVDDIAIMAIKKVMDRLELYPTIRTFGQLRAFTASVAYHLSNSQLRKVLGGKRNSGVTEPLDSSHERISDDSISPQDYAHINERAEVVSRAFEKVKKYQRELLHDFYLHGLKHKEIAEKYKIPVGTVGVYLQRALRDIKLILKSDPVLLEHSHLTAAAVALIQAILIA